MSRLSFRFRVIAVILGSSAAASLAITLILSLSGRDVLRSGYAERALVQARIVAAAATVPMAFQDAVDSAETLEQLAAVGGVRRAWILDHEGAVFVAWAADGAPVAPPTPGARPAATGTRFSGDGLLSSAEVATDDGEVLGRILLDIDLAPIAEGLAAQARLALGVLLVVLGVTGVVALQLQRRLTRPISDLVDLTQRIRGREDPAARAAPSRIPELRVLGDSLNAMLDELESRGRALSTANESLEERVRLRTDELRRAMARMESEIHVREQVEAELRKARQRAEAANAAKSAFLANMSHEIRTPMTAILGFAELLLDRSCDAGTAHDAAETIRRNGQHLIAIINDILDLSKIEAGRMQVERLEVDLPELLRDVVDLMQVRADGKGIGLGIDVPEWLPAHVQTDPVRLRQILVNLVGNAIKFTETGAVTIAVSYRERDRRLSFAVRDTGIGIDPDAAARLFQPFAQADDSMTRRFGGTGLGLVISRRLAELLGGGIELQSTPGRGSVFTVAIDGGATATTTRLEPAEFIARIRGDEAFDVDAGADADMAGAAPDDADPASRAAGPQLGPLHGLVVLLVEDGPDNRRLIAHHLRRAGATVHLREDGRAGAAAVLGPDAVAPDLILMDMQMPVMDGYAATRLLRAHGWNGPVIAITAHAMEGDRERCMAAGCDDYVAKPVDRVLLVERIRHLLQDRRAA